MLSHMDLLLCVWEMSSRIIAWDNYSPARIAGRRTLQSVIMVSNLDNVAANDGSETNIRNLQGNSRWGMDQLIGFRSILLPKRVARCLERWLPLLLRG